MRVVWNGRVGRDGNASYSLSQQEVVVVVVVLLFRKNEGDYYNTSYNKQHLFIINY